MGKDLMCSMLDSPLRWSVASCSREMWHVVDLAENNGYGGCGCEDWEFRIQPALDRGNNPGRRCKHLLAARDALCDLVVDKLIHQQTK